MQNCSSIVYIILYWGHVFPIISLYTPGGKPGKPGTFRYFNGSMGQPSLRDLQADQSNVYAMQAVSIDSPLFLL